MAHIMHQNTQTSQSTISHFLIKKVIKFLLSISLFSVIFSYSSLVLHSFKVHFSAVTMQIFSYTIDKNYMFLLCNGILVVIIKNSGLIGSSPPKTDLNCEHAIKNRDAQQEIPELSNAGELVAEVKEVEEQRENKLLITQDEDEEQEIEFIVIEEGEEEDGIGLLSAEELNKKCDDFIKKMKEGIKFEAQQLIMV